MHSEVGLVDVPLVVTDFDRLHFYLDWEGWEKDLVFEQRMRHRPSTESVFVGWHGVELFAVPARQNITLYHLVLT